MVAVNTGFGFPVILLAISEDAGTGQKMTGMPEQVFHKENKTF